MSDSQSFITLEAVLSAVARGELVRGRIRYHSQSVASVLCSSLVLPVRIVGADINHALPGDDVAVKLFPREQWQVRPAARTDMSAHAYSFYEGDDRAKSPQDNDSLEVVSVPCGRVVHVLKPGHITEVIGTVPFEPGELPAHFSDFVRCAHALSPQITDDHQRIMFTPQTTHFPGIEVTPTPGVVICPGRYYRVHIDDWPYGTRHPIGTIISDEGSMADIQASTQAIMQAANLREEEFSETIMAALPKSISQALEWEQVNGGPDRLDLRNDPETVLLTIDPATARDLDDALSVRILSGPTEPSPDTVYELGVHIADVTSFFARGSELDKRAARQSETLYLVQRAIHLLPRMLCEELCSINAAEDRMAFSILWRMTGKGDILQGDIFVGHSLIHSDARLSYEGAQALLEGRNIKDDPTLTNNDIKPGREEVVCRAIRHFAFLGALLRQQRAERKPLFMGSMQLEIELDEAGALPLGTHTHATLDTSSTIEEFMILANQLAALRLVASFPTAGLVRAHPAPDVTTIRSVLQYTHPDMPLSFTDGVEVMNTIRSAASRPPIFTKLRPANAEDDSYNHMFRYDEESYAMAIQSAFMQCGLKSAEYIIGPQKAVIDEWAHYGVGSQLYYHHTSPIRRYPDQLIHRMLTLALAIEKRECGYNAGFERDLSPEPSPKDHHQETGRSALRPHCLYWPRTQSAYDQWPRELLPPSYIVSAAASVFAKTGSDQSSCSTDIVEQKGGYSRKGNRGQLGEPHTVVLDSSLLDDDARDIILGRKPVPAPRITGEMALEEGEIELPQQSCELAQDPGDVARELIKQVNADLENGGFGDYLDLSAVLENCNERHKQFDEADSSSISLWLRFHMLLIAARAGFVDHSRVKSVPEQLPELRSTLVPEPVARLPTDSSSVICLFPALAFVTSISPAGRISLTIPRLNINLTLDLNNLMYSWPEGEPIPSIMEKKQGAPDDEADSDDEVTGTVRGQTDRVWPYSGAPVGWSVVEQDRTPVAIEVRRVDLSRPPLSTDTGTHLSPFGRLALAKANPLLERIAVTDDPDEAERLAANFQLGITESDSEDLFEERPEAEFINGQAPINTRGGDLALIASEVAAHHLLPTPGSLVVSGRICILDAVPIYLGLSYDSLSGTIEFLPRLAPGLAASLITRNASRHAKGEARTGGQKTQQKAQRRKAKEDQWKEQQQSEEVRRRMDHSGRGGRKQRRNKGKEDRQ